MRKEIKKTDENIRNLLRTQSDKYNIRNYNPSSFEIDVAGLLIKNNITFEFNKKLVFYNNPNNYNIFKKWIDLKNNTISTNIDIENKSSEIFRPDFIINDLKSNNKPIILEPHGKQYFHNKKINKYKSFMNLFGSSYYFIIITDLTRKILETKLKELDLKLNDICNELWFSKKNNLNSLDSKINKMKIKYQLR